MDTSVHTSNQQSIKSLEMIVETLRIVPACGGLLQRATVKSMIDREGRMSNCGEKEREPPVEVCVGHFDVRFVVDPI